MKILINLFLIHFIILSSLFCVDFAFAQSNKSSPSDTTINPSETVTEKNLKLEKLNAEIEKLRAEIDDIKITNEASGPSIRRITTILGAAGGIAGALIGFLIWILGRSFTNKISKNQDAKLQQDKELSRETHNLELFRSLSDDNPRIQLAAASVLIQRLHGFRDKRKEGPLEKSEEMEKPTIIQVLLAVTKEDPADEDSAPKALWKLIADNIVIAIDAIVPENEEPSSDISPLKKMDFQKSHLTNAWWERVDARGVDFYKSDLSRAGLAGSFLKDTTFYKTNLKSSVLRNANLTNADLREANLKNANLSEAKLEGARLTKAKYNSKTQWPDNFDYVNSGAILEEDVV